MRKPKLAAVLNGLKDFQRDTVDYVFARLYEGNDQVRRFLLADEVGLGKTLVTRGVVARAIEKLWESTERIDVIYICSNADIARQNVERLRIGETGEFKLATRITRLPVLVDKMHQRLNFLSFTPGTSFDLKSSMGMADERALLFRMLHEHWGLRGRRIVDVFAGDSSPERFKQQIKASAELEINAQLHSQFLDGLDDVERQRRDQGRPLLREIVESVRERLATSRAKLSREEYVQRRDLIAELRSTLAATCLEALEPDIIILDEFQRFRHLLDEDDESGRLARKLFNYSDEKTSARVLLVSATPYKMYTADEEGGGDNHYEDFLATLRFLSQDLGIAQRVGEQLNEYHRALIRVGETGVEPIRVIKESIERDLRRVMVRTERLAATVDRDGMLSQMPCEGLRLSAEDATDFVGLERIGDVVERKGTVEYWKSAPYLLSFMEQYDLKKKVDQAETEPNVSVASLLRTHDTLLLPWSSVEGYKQVDWRNARLRWLASDTLDRGAWRLLWTPPTSGSFAPGGVFAEPSVRGFTKRLLFSAWNVVPKAVASLISYEAERRMMLGADPNATNTADERRARRGLLRFARADGRLTGLPLFVLFYPSPSLAVLGDPRTAERLATTDSADRFVESIAATIEHELAPHLSGREDIDGLTDERWYWVAPLLLDLARDSVGTRRWLANPTLADVWSGEISSSDATADEETDAGWKDHVVELRRAVDQLPEMGTPPEDLFVVLARAAIAGPANASLRALSRIAGGRTAIDEGVLRTSAARMAWGFRSLFNIPEVMSLLRSLNAQEPYWHRVIEYCVDGDLGAVLEEYVHVLRESLGLIDRNRFESAAIIADHVRGVLGLRTSVLGVDEIRALRSGRLEIEKRRIRTRFAMRFGEQTSDEAESALAGRGAVGKTRGDQVRWAFNSPFWPFVLASTSVGQEGLDFHQYCHAVVHWNLPSNPVDLEQREGRVHRYKGHAVRKNVAMVSNGLRMSADASGAGADPWEVMFATASERRLSSDSDLVPFWLFPIEGGAKIERYVPALPLSRDTARYSALQRSLAVYRMAFGQPRQDDLVAYLLRVVERNRLAELGASVQIDLAPPKSVRNSWSAVVREDRPDVWSAAAARMRFEGRSSTSVLRRPRTVEELTATRRDLDAARQVFESLFPAVELRRMIQEQLAASIRAAHDVNQHSWAVTLFAGGNILVRLNVGGIEALTLDAQEEDRLMLVIRGAAVDRDFRDRLRAANIVVQTGGYKSEPSARVVFLADGEILRWLPEFQHAHLSMVRVAASHVRTRTAALKQHSPAVTEYLRSEAIRLPADPMTSSPK